MTLIYSVPVYSKLAKAVGKQIGSSIDRTEFRVFADGELMD